MSVTSRMGVHNEGEMKISFSKMFGPKRGKHLPPSVPRQWSQGISGTVHSAWGIQASQDTDRKQRSWESL